jgi:hypothetical protein
MYDPAGSSLAEVCHIFHVRGQSVLQYPILRQGILCTVPAKGYRYRYTIPLTRNTLHASDGRDPNGSYIAADICVHNPDNINNYKYFPQEADYFIVLLLLKQYGLTLVNSCNLEF